MEQVSERIKRLFVSLSNEKEELKNRLYIELMITPESNESNDKAKKILGEIALLDLKVNTLSMYFTKEQRTEE